MGIETHDFSFSVDQPETLLKPLLALLQPEPDQSKTGTSRSAYLLESQSILIIDSDRIRANAVAQFVHVAGYRSVIAETALEAFTLFLKGVYIPRVVFLGQDSPPDHLFLQRLLQQTVQKYGRKVPLIRLHTIASTVSPDISPRAAPSQSLQKLPPHQLQQPMSGIEQIEREKINLFQQEVDLLGMPDHAHIQAPLNIGRSYVSGSPFIYKTMPYYPERSLAQWLLHHGKQKTFLAREVIYVALQLADALQYIHEHQILYQNFKLTNLLVRDPSNDIRGLHLILSDFAIAQDGSFFSRTPEAFPYMAPERWQNLALPASDQYGLAAIIYELLTRRPPFQGGSEYTMRLLHVNMQPQPPSSFNPMLTPAIDQVILRALAKRPEDRFPTVEAFAQTLRRYC